LGANYSGVEVQLTLTRTEIINLATRMQNVLAEEGRLIQELTAVVQKRFDFPEGNVELYAEKVATRGLCAIIQAESLLQTPRKPCCVEGLLWCGVLWSIMENRAKAVRSWCLGNSKDRGLNP